MSSFKERKWASGQKRVKVNKTLLQVTRLNTNFRSWPSWGFLRTEGEEELHNCGWKHFLYFCLSFKCNAGSMEKHLHAEISASKCRSIMLEKLAEIGVSSRGSCFHPCRWEPELRNTCDYRWVIWPRNDSTAPFQSRGKSHMLVGFLTSVKKGKRGRRRPVEGGHWMHRKCELVTQELSGGSRSGVEGEQKLCKPHTERERGPPDALADAKSVCLHLFFCTPPPLVCFVRQRFLTSFCQV